MTDSNKSLVLEVVGLVPVYSQDAEGRFGGFQVQFAPVVVSPEVVRLLPLEHPYRVRVVLVSDA